MNQYQRVLFRLVLAATLTACGDDASNNTADSGADADAGSDIGADTIEPDAQCGDGVELDNDGICDEPVQTCEDGIDVDGDGVCDRERSDWSRDARLTPGTNRRDIFGLGDAMPKVASDGLRHALIWPVTVSGALLPYRPVMALFDPYTEDATLASMQGLARARLGFGNIDEMYDWLGLARYDGSEFAFAEVRWPDGAALGGFPRL